MKEKSIVIGYDYSDQAAREATASDLFNKAKQFRTGQENEWLMWDDYYNFIHNATKEMQQYCDEKNIPFAPAVLPDCYIQVESQIVPDVPEPEFRGRDDDQDSEKAKIRELAVRYVMENNRVSDMNTSNERRLVKYGDAFWKVYWDRDMRCGLHEGDIAVKDIPVEDIYADPSCGAAGLQAGQYVDHVYRMHKVEFAIRYERELKKLGLTVDELVGSDYEHGKLFSKFDNETNEYDDCVQILEHWFKQPVSYYDKEEKIDVPAGAVACSMQVMGHEVNYIPMYWQNTGKQCRLFPFVQYWRIRDETEFYNKSELFAIRDLVDAGDRKFGNAILNDTMTANDIIIAEENAFADGHGPSNEPGAIWMMKPNKRNAVGRLGGLQSMAGSDAIINYITEQIQRTTRNYDSNLGKETSRQTTATGLAMLRDDANTQADIKKKDRLLGFERLFELIDWHCLEFFDDERLIFLGAKDEYSQPETAMYSSHALTTQMPAVYDTITGEMVRDAWEYYPKVDVTVNAGDGIIKGKQATVNALEKLSAANVTQANYKLLLAELDILDLPQKKEIGETWEQLFAPAVPKEVTDALAANPELLQLVTSLAMASQLGGEEIAVPEMQAGIAPAVTGAI